MIDTLLQRVPTLWAALVTLGTALAFGAVARDRVYSQAVLPARVDSTKAQVDSLEIQFYRHMAQDVPAMRRQIDFMYCREVERSGEKPPVPCLQIIK